jgi:biopolymer transport protein ExbD
MNTGSKATALSFAEINVTPMCDIMIVLLVIFMVVTPKLNEERGLDPPPSRTARDLQASRAPVVLIHADGLIEMGGEAFASPAELMIRLFDRLQEDSREGALVQVKADRGLRYGQVQAVLAACRTAGARRVALMAVREPS